MARRGVKVEGGGPGKIDRCLRRLRLDRVDEVELWEVLLDLLLRVRSEGCSNVDSGVGEAWDEGRGSDWVLENDSDGNVGLGGKRDPGPGLTAAEMEVWGLGSVASGVDGFDIVDSELE